MFAAGGTMSLRRCLGRASNLLILGLLLLAASAVFPGELSAQTAPKADAGKSSSALDKQKPAAAAINLPLFFEANSGQTADSGVRFLTRSNGYTMFLKPTETVLVGHEPHKINAKTGKPDLKSPLKAPVEVRMELLGANAAPQMTGADEMPGKVNYLIGNNQSAWHTGVALFGQVKTEQVYPGVDLLFHGDQQQLEYDFVVAPGADASRVAFKILGAKKIEITANGDLVLHTAGSDFKMHKPAIYQAEGAGRREVQGGFVLSAKNEVRFELGPYDRSQQLVIDPTIKYASFLGGNGLEDSSGIAVDDSTPGSPKLYVAGFTTDSTTFPASSFSPPVVTTIGAGTSTSTTFPVDLVGFVAKIDPTKTGQASLVYLTFVGGKTPVLSNSTTGCFSGFVWLGLDKSQGASGVQPVIGGQTTCSDFPNTTVLSPVTDPTGTSTGVSALAIRLTASGNAMDKSALLGGNNNVDGGFVAVDTAGNVLLTSSTQATNLPVKNAYIGAFNNGTVPAAYDDCYLSKLNRADLSVSYATYLNVGGGSTQGNSAGCGAFEDSSGNILAGGDTFSATAFNLGAGGASLANGFQPAFRGTENTFAIKLNPALSGVNQLIYATYYGGGGTTEGSNGSFDLGNGVVAIVGNTNSATTGANAPDIPLKNAYQSTNLAAASANGQTGFVFLIDTTKTGANSLLCSTYFGGSSGNDQVQALTYDAADPTSYRIIIGGATGSTDFPTLNPLQGFVGTGDAFVSVLKVPQPGQSFNASLYFSTFIGSGTILSEAGSVIDYEQVEGAAVDSNHTIYLSGYALSSNFFANTTPATTINGFQTGCAHCGTEPGANDLVLFSIGTGPGATVQSITVTPASASIATGKTQQFDAEAFYSDGTIQDITSTATWASSSTAVAQIGSNGLASGLGAGTTTITANLGGITSSGATLTVTGGATTFQVQVVLEGTAYGTVTDKTGAINCTDTSGQGTTGSCSAMFASGTAVTLTQTVGSGSVFAAWGVSIGDAGCAGTTTTCTFTPDEQEQVTATFNNGTGNFALKVIPGTTATGGGIVTGSIGGTGTIIDCTLNGTTTPTGVCTQNILSGSITTLTAEPNSTSNFTSWSGPCVIGSLPVKCIVTMGAAQTVTALFTAQSNPFAVSVTGNGTVTSTSTPTIATEINCANPGPPSVCTTNFNSGTSVSLAATGATGQSFNGWTAGPCNATMTNPCTFTVSNTTATTATATFITNTYLLTVNRAGTAGGTITSNPVNAQLGTITCGPAAGIQGCAVSATYNTAVTLTEIPPTGGGFSGWSGVPTNCTVSGATCTFNMPAAAETVTGTFTSVTAGGADLSITVTAPSAVALEANVPYTITVTNNGPAAATGVAMTDAVPDGLTPETVVGPNCESDPVSGVGYTVLCNIGNLASGASATITFMLSPDTAGTITNTASVAGTQADPNTSNNSATATTVVGSVDTGQAIVADFGADEDYQTGFDDKQRVDGKTPPLQIILTNTSAQTVTFTGVSADNPAYTVGMNCTVLAPGQTCIVHASFTTTSTCQNQFGIITVQDNDPGGNLVLPINGFGADTGIQVNDLTDSSLTAQALAQSLVGSGVTISNVTYTGSARAAGNFTSSKNILGFTSGVALSTGSVRNVVGPNCVSGPSPAANDEDDTGISVDNVQPGDADLNNIVGEGHTTFDASVLEFDFVPTSTSISFQYVFTSDEYNEFVGQFNDVFGFFLTAPGGVPVNIALIPGTSLPVSINNVNDGNPDNTPPTPPTNAQFYINNEFLPAAAPLDTEMNGLTTTFTAQATVIPGQTYHIKLAIADADDNLYDSNVFVQTGSLTSADVTAFPTTLAFGGQAQGTTSSSLPVTVTNVGTTAVTIVSITPSTNFTQTNTCPASLTTGTGTGSSCTVNVSFAPTTTGALTGTLTVTYTSTGSTTQQTTTVTLSGTGTPGTGGTISIAPGSLTFGPQAQGTTSAPQTVTVTNTGGTTVTFTSIVTTGDFAGASTSLCASIAVEGSCTFSITFTPTGTGTRSGAITFTDNATGSPQGVSLAGTGTAGNGAIGISPTSLTFASQNVGTTSAPQSVTVTNTGGTTVTFAGFTVTGTNAGDFGVPLPNSGAMCNPAGTLAGGANCTINVLFKPGATGTRTATLNIADNATGSPQKVTLTGTGASGTATVSVTPTSLTFASQALTTTSAPQTVTVKNTGTAAVNITGLNIPGGIFAIATGGSGACSTTTSLAGGASCTIGVTFTPTESGAASGTLSITDNATGSPQMVALSGTGVNTPVIIAIAPGGSNSATTVSGGTAYYGLVISGATGVTGKVGLGCVPSSNLITCNVIPNTVVLNGTPTEVAFGIQTFCQGTSTATGFAPPGGIGGAAGLLLAMLFGGAVWVFRSNRRVALTFATLLLVAMGSAACNSLPQGPNGATPAGTYTLSLTWTLNNGQTQTLNDFLTLKVQ
jgi:uncharacterized repeat protein (TIGR01451 family)